jgi:hypothetical protein
MQKLQRKRNTNKILMRIFDTKIETQHYIVSARQNAIDSSCRWGKFFFREGKRHNQLAPNPPKNIRSRPASWGSIEPW